MRKGILERTGYHYAGGDPWNFHCVYNDRTGDGVIRKVCLMGRLFLFDKQVDNGTC